MGAVIDDGDDNDWRTPKSLYDRINVYDQGAFAEACDQEHRPCPLCSKPTGMDIRNPIVRGSYGGIESKCLDCFVGMHYRYLK